MLPTAAESTVHFPGAQTQCTTNLANREKSSAWSTSQVHPEVSIHTNFGKRKFVSVAFVFSLK